MNDYPKNMKILLIEDEFILATELKRTLQKEGYEVVEVCDNGPEALEFFKENEVDLVLCDISILGDWDGIETATRLLEIKPIPLIYLTALADTETIERAKQTFPAAYIPKPYNLQNLRLAMEMAINNFAIKVNPVSLKILPKNDTNHYKETILQVNEDIFIKQNYQFVKFPLNEILYLEADNMHTTIVTSAKKYAIRQTLSTILERLPTKSLIRVHRSYAVNLNKIDSFNEHEIMIGLQAIPLSRGSKDEFLKHFMFR
jgi:two-component system, response regulator PdtaR